MSDTLIAQAIERVERAFVRRPDKALHDDAPATARWDGGLRVVVEHPSGARVPTDMPVDFGGTGEHVTPGWLFRAGLAACAAASIRLHAVRAGVALTRLELCAGSRSDARGLLGMTEADGTPVPGGPRDLTLRVRIAADGVSDEALRGLVERAVGCSPVPSAAREALPLALQIETD